MKKKLQFNDENISLFQVCSLLIMLSNILQSLELKYECSERLKRVLFSFFANFWVTELKPFSGKVRQRLQIYLNQNLIIRTFLENSFEAFWSSITNILFVWKGHFSVFLQIFKWRRRNCFRGKWDNTAKSFSIKSTLLRGF